jgi:hypothetical protein
VGGRCAAGIASTSGGILDCGWPSGQASAHPPADVRVHRHREEQDERLSLGANRTGRLLAIRHEKVSITSPFDDWRARTGHLRPALGVSELPGRPQADPRQHDDADVHPRSR